MAENFNIGGTIIPPGHRETVRLPVGRLPSGNQITIQAHIFRSANPGPTMLLLAGMHGDEINGIEIVRRAISTGILANLKCGSVIAISLINVYGFINFSRDVMESKDVNRSFPGSSSGSMASRVARVLTRHILPYVDFAIDFHTGGKSRYNFPQIRFSAKDVNAARLAEVFNPPLRVIKSNIPKSFRRIGYEMGIPVIVYEGGESLRLDEFSIDEGIRGIKRLLNEHKMDYFPIPIQPSVLLPQSFWIRANNSGIFSFDRLAGMYVHKGEILGHISDPYGMNSQPVISNRQGTLICNNNHPVVFPGDPLFNIGVEATPKKIK